MSAITSVTIDFSNPTIRANPHPVYRGLREESPVVWNDVTGSWLISRYDDVVSLFTNPAMSSARTEAIFATLTDEQREELAPMRGILSGRMLLTDPPEHTRLKNLVMKAFSARSTEVRRERIRELCDGFLDQVGDRGELDVVHDFAEPLPSWVIAEMVGVPQADQAMFSRWARGQVRVYDRPGTVHDRLSVMRQGQASMLEMKAYLNAIIEKRRREPREDLITELVRVEEEGDRLSTDEMVVMIVALLVGGNNSTAHLIGNAALTLLRHPEVIERLRSEPGLVRGVIEETLRWESPVQATSRVVRGEVEVGGQMLRDGDMVHLLIGSANRDVAQFPDPDPDSFAPERHPNRHLTFAHGPHFCLGSSVARATAQTAVLALVERYPGLRLATDAPTAWQDGFSFRSVTTLPVRFDR